MIPAERIREDAESLHTKAVETRRHLHRNPELSFHETQTAAYISTRLTEIGVPFRDRIAGNGIVGTVTGGLPGGCIALRADMDALAITEETEHDYRSTNDGVMHACGHDSHVSSLLMTAEILMRNRESLPGSVELIFQPAEEIAGGGAKQMLEENALPPAVKYVFGQHVNTDLPVGTVGFHSGLFMASADEIYITVEGHGGHAAKPHEAIDPIVIGSQLVIALQQIVSRSADPTVPSVLTFGKFAGMGAANVIPDRVLIEGTFRTIDEAWRNDALSRIESVSRSLTSALGGSATIRIVRGMPPLVNDTETTDLARERAAEYLGEDAVVEVPPAMWSEDFAYFALFRPSCFYNLGVRNEERGIIHPVHTSKFDIDEDALKIGGGLLAWIAIGALERAGRRG